MSRMRVGVLRGGPSGEYEVSLQTGGSVLKHLPVEHYDPVDILISKDGAWHRNGIPTTIAKALRGVNVIFNALHGEYGEDGKVQRQLDLFGVPYTGSGSLSSAIGMNKALAKKRFITQGIKTPLHKTISESENTEEKLLEIFRTFPHPMVVKPATAGSSLGVSIVRTYPELEKALKKAFAYSKKVLIEEFIAGREASCGVVDGYRNSDVYALFPVEIIPQESSFFDYDAKYKGRSIELCPSTFSNEIKKEIEELAVKVHKVLELRHYSRTDVIISPRRGIYVLEVNTLPGLMNESLLPKSLRAVGFEFPDFLHHVISLALDKK